tara:strand:- start:14 stop:172 length:159 start_codon:yes stop_codon:yes gene_type:complete
MTVNVRHWKSTTGRNNPIEVVEEETKPVAKKRDNKGRYKKKVTETVEETVTE